MAHGDFVWCDLSAFDVGGARELYARVFGWTYRTITQPDGSDYHLAAAGHDAGAAIFEMPQKFQDLGLPSFWMPYIEVDNIEHTVKLAAGLGGKVEVGPVPFSDHATIALIRDPLGAGFTVCQGEDLVPRRTAGVPGRMVWNALHVSDAAAVTGFYETLFGWRISADGAPHGTHDVRRTAGDKISEIHEIPDELRGEHQFWGVHFSVADLAAAGAQVRSGGGGILYEGMGNDGPGVLAHDPGGAAFFLVEAKAARDSAATLLARLWPKYWKSALAVATIWIAVFFEMNWVWGVLFLMWTIPALQTGRTYFVEPVNRDDDAVVFWLIVGSWIVLSVVMILYDLGALIGAGT